ncbi:rRNA maturation RNase YbeY [Pelagovum pacificum]|uniref:Endoribonuclease YbeY n=1 Tax=Pelagovum pacificum TaxID=2588711 RepID=A0A5C5GHG4_9RHOB|nr:rRNA maturation RNase YbeY [Pelagovum pacificum]QQA43316.1 rRNA maturation RNase YbeY [Pelagovum pacificum]TNY33547.1 rRNA maturation RNase YbeY [Pelagovum pacificum]
MTVDVVLEDDRWEALGLGVLAERATEATLDRLGLEPTVWGISILACDDARIAGLNGEFRGKDRATNVLSWPSEERAAFAAGETPLAPDPADPELGDIAIAYETCEQEARDAEKPLQDHVLHLLIHGTLHLLGYDHVRDLDADLMEGLEVEILGKLGLPNPYGT